MKRRGLPWKWVVVTEYENQRIHHHIVCNREALTVILNCWKEGHVHHVQLDTNGNYYDLAEYLCKETEKTFRDPDAVARQRYDRSRNLIVPQPRNERITKREYEEEIRDPSGIEGYRILEDGADAGANHGKDGNELSLVDLADAFVCVRVPHSVVTPFVFENPETILTHGALINVSLISHHRLKRRHFPLSFCKCSFSPQIFVRLLIQSVRATRSPYFLANTVIHGLDG